MPLLQSVYLALVFSVLSKLSTAAPPNLPFVAVYTTKGTLTNHLKPTLGISISKRSGWETQPGEGDLQGKANVWIRGSSSAMFPKKPYRLELVDENGRQAKASLLGMPKESDWILFPAYADKTMMRDVLGYELWRAMGHYSVRWRYVELFIMTNSEVQMPEAVKLLRGERAVAGKAESGKRRADGRGRSATVPSRSNFRTIESLWNTAEGTSSPRPSLAGHRACRSGPASWGGEREASHCAFDWVLPVMAAYRAIAYCCA